MNGDWQFLDTANQKVYSVGLYKIGFFLIISPYMVVSQMQLQRMHQATILGLP